MNMSVPEACDVDSREKMSLLVTNAFFRFFGNFFMKNLAYEKLNPYICHCVMEYPLMGAAKHIYY